MPLSSHPTIFKIRINPRRSTASASLHTLATAFHVAGGLLPDRTTPSVFLHRITPFPPHLTFRSPRRTPASSNASTSLQHELSSLSTPTNPATTASYTSVSRSTATIAFRPYVPQPYLSTLSGPHRRPAPTEQQMTPVREMVWKWTRPGTCTSRLGHRLAEVKGLTIGDVAVDSSWKDMI